MAWRLRGLCYQLIWCGHPGSAVWFGFEPQSDRGPLHFHMPFVDGVYVEDGHGKLRFHRVKAPNVDELKSLVHAISHRVDRGSPARQARAALPLRHPAEGELVAKRAGFGG